MILLRAIPFVSVLLMLKLTVYSCFHVTQSQEVTSLNFLNSQHVVMLESYVLLIEFFHHGMIFLHLLYCKYIL